MLRAAILFTAALSAHAQMTCDLTDYKALEGLTAKLANNALTVNWQGSNREPLRVEFTITNGIPTIRELAARNITLGQNLQPEFQITSGVRRLSTQQSQPLEF